MKIRDYKMAINGLEALLKIEGDKIPFKVSLSAPEKYKEMKDFYKDNGYYLIFEGGSDSTIFSSPYINHLFRACHDKAHYDNNLSFSFKDEKRVAQIQAKGLFKLAREKGFSKKLSYNIFKIIIVEVTGQIEYYQRYNNFVKNQKAFSERLLIN